MARIIITFVSTRSTSIRSDRQGLSKEDANDAMKGHVLDKGELTGIYGRAAT